ncbi:hypothetical protein HYE59_00805 [Aggregatibacter actinomycetemcomitans]|uniref:hypothetical protein n=1 Tax=Aggregatibacter actinomycetemcomitans TaxID=714 RepID=UPI00197C3A43|nr:hypothetical protein [Aggregatibacter actinomycetemcomitans]MBN6076115.1 hypothetical protein [Aggregatibacter actinomycetemcomitans]
MKYKEELLSGRTPQIKKAARIIRKENLEGYSELLHNALASEIEKTKSWETQLELIYAIALTRCIEEIPYLKELATREFSVTPVVYRALSFAIVYLQNFDKNLNLLYFYEALDSDNLLLAAGACAAIYKLKVDLASDDIRRIITYVTKPVYLEELGKVSNPIFFILALSYLWPNEYKDEIIAKSKALHNPIIDQIISSVMKNRPANLDLF